jgi:hypothetical protein
MRNFPFYQAYLSIILHTHTHTHKVTQQVTLGIQQKKVTGLL